MPGANEMVEFQSSASNTIRSVPPEPIKPTNVLVSRRGRYETPSSLARDIERYLHDEQVQACPPG
jgi:hypothetical protein